MKNIVAYFIIIGLLVSCSQTKKMSNQDKGVAIGAGGGAVVGGVIGKAVGGNPAVGAVIGAVVGGTAGGIIGHHMDKQKKELEEIKEAKVESIKDGEGLKVTFEEGILFATNSSTLNPSSQDALTKFSTSLNNTKETNVVISGHTDNTGNDAINDPLSEKRANSVANYLKSKGVSGKRLTTVGAGSRQPVATNETAEGRQQNRRVEVVIVANDKMVKSAKKEAGTK